MKKKPDYFKEERKKKNDEKRSNIGKPSLEIAYSLNRSHPFVHECMEHKDLILVLVVIYTFIPSSKVSVRKSCLLNIDNGIDKKKISGSTEG